MIHCQLKMKAKYLNTQKKKMSIMKKKKKIRMKKKMMKNMIMSNRLRIVTSILIFKE
jgi:hypothetical protein